MSFDISEFLDGLDEGRDRALAAGVDAVDQFANHVIGKSQDLAPKKTGTLAGSGVAEDAKVSAGGKDITAVIGHNTDYAAAVHERINVHHDNGQAKYLETAMRQEAHKLKPTVEAAMRSAL